MHTAHPIRSGDLNRNARSAKGRTERRVNSFERRAQFVATALTVILSACAATAISAALARLLVL